MNETLTANTSTILCAFGHWSDGAQLRVAYNHFDLFTYFNQTESTLVTTGVSQDGSQLVQFEVVQNACAGDWVQPYSLTIYQIVNPSDPPAVPTSVCDTTTIAVFADISYESAWLQLFTNYLLNGCSSQLCSTPVNGLLTNPIILATLQQFLNTILPINININNNNHNINNNNNNNNLIFPIGESIKAIIAIDLGCSQYALTTAPFDLNGFMSASTTHSWSNDTFNAFNYAWINATLSVGVPSAAITQAVAPFLIQ